MATDRRRVESPLDHAWGTAWSGFCERALVTVVSPNYAGLTALCLDSLFARSDFSGRENRLFFLAFGADHPDLVALAARFHATLIPCESDPAAPTPLVAKALIYALPHLLCAERYLFFDSDILFFDSPKTFLDRLDITPDRHLLAPPKSPLVPETMGQMFSRIYRADAEEVRRLVGFTEEEEGAPFGVNSGILAGKRTAWLELHDRLLGLGDGAREFLWRNPSQVYWREDGLLSLLLWRHQCGTLLAAHEHVNVSGFEVRIVWDGGRPIPLWQSQPALSLHFVGSEAKEEMRRFGPACGFTPKPENLPALV